MSCSRLYPLRILSRKWSYLVLRALKEPMGFSDIQRELRFITNRILSRELGLLQEEDLLVKEDAEYSLSGAGKALLEALEPLVQWSIEYKNLRPCPPEQQCSRCAYYAQAIGAKEYLNVSK